MSLTELSLGGNNLGPGMSLAFFYGVGADRLVQNQMTYKDGLGVMKCKRFTPLLYGILSGPHQMAGGWRANPLKTTLATVKTSLKGASTKR
jgi:hypothetical protein